MVDDVPTGWRARKFRNVMRLKERRELIEPTRTYKLLGVRWYGSGAFLREERTGEGLSAQHIYRVQAGDVIYNRLFAWKGSFGLVSDELAGCYVSNEFPLFVTRPDKIVPQFLLRILQLPRTSERADAFSTGTTSISRNRLGEDDFLQFPLNLPPIAEQHAIAEVLTAIDDAIARTASLIDVVEGARDNLVEAALSELRRDTDKDGVCRLRDVAEVRTGVSKSKNRQLVEPCLAPYLRVANVQDGYLDLREIKRSLSRRPNVLGTI